VLAGQRQAQGAQESVDVGLGAAGGDGHRAAERGVQVAQAVYHLGLHPHGAGLRGDVGQGAVEVEEQRVVRGGQGGYGHRRHLSHFRARGL